MFDGVAATQIIVPIGSSQSYIDAGVAAGYTDGTYGGLTIQEAGA